MIDTTLNAAVGLVAALYFFAVMGLSPARSGRAFIREQWRTATDSLYETFRFLPLVVAAVGWVALVILTSQLGADIAAALLALGVPVYVAGLVALRVRDRFRAWIGKREMKAHPGAFALPMRVQESSGAVSTWSDRVAVPSGKSILALGATRSGKTEAVKHFLQQLGTAPNAPTVVYDRKTDFRDFYEERGAEYIRLSSTEGGFPHVQERTARWNLFRELDHGADADALARSLFPTGDGGGGGTEFFDQAARQLFAAVVTYLKREVGTEDLDNAALVSYFQRTDAETMYDDLTSYEDLTAAASAINPDASRQSAGVYASVQQRVSDLFVGEFGESGDFSVRQYVSNPDGRVLLLDYPETNGETVGPIFSFLVDEAIRAGLSRPQQDSRYVLDEFATIGSGLRKIDDLVNVGAGKNCQAILTLQSIGQLNSMVGKQRANSLLAGLSTSIILRMQDPESVRYARARIGRRIEEKTGHVERQPSPTGEGSVVTKKETKQVEEHEFSEQDLQQLPPGYAIVAREDGWAAGQLAMLPEPRRAR